MTLSVMVQQFECCLVPSRETPEGCPVPVMLMSWMKDGGAVLFWMYLPNAAPRGFRLTEPTFHSD